MHKNLRFFRISEGPQAGWYADVPGHTLAENEMVAGSDEFLDKVSTILGGSRDVTISLSDDNQAQCFIAKLDMRAHNQWGATYVLTGPAADKYAATGFQLWICNVSHDVFGEHPRTIYIHEIRCTHVQDGK